MLETKKAFEHKLLNSKIIMQQERLCMKDLLHKTE